MFENLIFKKSKISGVALNGSISADWLFRVANFGFNYLRHFFNNFANSCAHLVACCKFPEFFKTPPTFIIWWFWRELWTKKQKKSDIRKYANLKPTLKFNLFWGRVFSTFFLIIWFKSTKIKFRPQFTMDLVEKIMKKT